MLTPLSVLEACGEGFGKQAKRINDLEAEVAALRERLRAVRARQHKASTEAGNNVPKFGGVDRVTGWRRGNCTYFAAARWMISQ